MTEQTKMPPLPLARWTPIETTLGYAWSEDQMHEYGKLCRQQALEEVAKLLDDYDVALADAIRSIA